jgi:DNA-binding NarL/FixJ family response regulator
MQGMVRRTGPGAVEPVGPEEGGPAIPRAVLPDKLSAREWEVLELVATGCTNREIGVKLYISPNTAANHVRSILQKTGCANRTEAATYAARHSV